MPDFVLTPQVFAILGALVEEKAGLHFSIDKKDLFADRVAERALELGFESPLDYYYYLRYDDPAGKELQTLIETLTVHESYFFRELDQLELAADLLATAARAGKRPRAWSAACASGEEPITLAMLLAERGVLDKVEIVASDISSKALARARTGTFNRRAVRSTPPRSVATRWIQEKDERFIVSPAILSAIQWCQANLALERDVASFGSFDVIFCRNVLIYFQDATAAQVVARLCRHLHGDGTLFVGVSESLIRFDSVPLDCHELGGVFCYRKAGNK